MYVSIDEIIPKVGDLGYIKHDEKDIRVAVVRHFIEEKTLCFMRQMYPERPELAWDLIKYFDKKWMPIYIGSNLSAWDVMHWVLSGSIPEKALTFPKE